MSETSDALPSAGDTAMIDHERLFRLIYDRQWSEAAALLHRHHQEVPSDPLLHRASVAFLESVEAALSDAVNPPDADLLEKLFLLHQGRFLALPDSLFERVVLLLVRAHHERPDAAIAYARYCPKQPECARVLEELGDPIRERVAHREEERIHVTASHSAAADGTRPLLRSDQEASFFQAAREAFPTFLVYPNVALNAVLDYESVRERLSREERRYFFHALVDCVVFDEREGYRPRYFFELDSPLHDDALRQKKDLLKDRILAAAGQHLYRIRVREGRANVTRFAALIRDSVRP